MVVAVVIVVVVIERGGRKYLGTTANREAVKGEARKFKIRSRNHIIVIVVVVVVVIVVVVEVVVVKGLRKYLGTTANREAVKGEARIY